MKKSIVILILSLVTTAMVSVSPVHANPTTKLSVIFPNGTSSSIGEYFPPDTFTVNVNIEDVTDLYTFDLRLNYDTAVLTANNITLGDFYPPGSMIWVEDINDDTGYIWYTVGLPLGTRKGQGVSGSGTLATISFTVDAEGETILDLFFTELSNSYAILISHKAYDGYFNVPRPWVYVDPPSINKAVGSNFTINVNVFNVTNLHSSEFKLAYNITLLDFLNITEGSFMADFGETSFTSNINETLGIVEANVTLVDSIGATTPNWPEAGNGTLVTVTFNVTVIGECDLDVYDTKLTDPTKTPIEYIAFNGYFSNKAVFHDIAITNVTTTVTTMATVGNITIPEVRHVSEVHAGEKVNITAYVKNNGNVAETFNITAYYNTTAVGPAQMVTSLSPGSSRTLTFTWDTANVSPGVYTIKANVTLVDDDMTNNELIKEGVFNVLPGGPSFPLELVAAIGIILVIAVIAVYFLKIRKPKPA